MKKIALLASAFALTAGSAFADNHDVKVSGQVFANYHMNQSEDFSSPAGKSNGFNVDRARLKVDAKINDTWRSHLAIEAKQGTDNSAYWIKKAYLHADKMFMDNDYFRFGVTSNLYKDNVYKHVSTRWIEKIGGDSANNAKGEHAGLRWGMKANKFHFALDYHNGHQDNKTSGTADEVTGLAIFASYHINDMMGLHLYNNSNAEAKSGTAASKTDVTSLAFNYNHSMFDTLFEYTSKKTDTAGAKTEKNMRLTLDYKYADKKSVYLSYNNFNDDNDSADVTKSQIVVGPTFTLAKGLKTGVFYTMATVEKDANPNNEDEKSIDWRWEAKF
jgi:hypothetical protein